MRLFGRGSDAGDDLTGLERRLRDERPEPPRELVQRLAADAGGRRALAGRPAYALRIAVGMTGLMLAAVVALSAVASPLDSAGDLLGFEQSADSTAQGPATDQYGELVTICDRSDDGQRTILVTAETAEALLAEDPRDSRGVCPAPAAAEAEVVISGDGPGVSPAAPAPDSLPLTGFAAGLLAAIGLFALITGLLARRAARD